METLKRTVFFEEHVKLQAKMVDFGGWEMPIQYAGLSKEHNNTRTNVGLFDVSHMGEVWIEGPDAEAAVKRWVTSSVDVDDGQAQYSLLCNHSGGVVDDIILYRFTKEKFLLCINAANRNKDVAWLQESALPEHDVQIIDVSNEYAQVAIQGRYAEDTLNKLTELSLNELAYYHFTTGMVGGVAECIVARTGYTGEDGFEIFIPLTDVEAAKEMWPLILKVGEEFDIQPVGLGARDTLRLEARMNLYGNEMSDDKMPHESGVAWTVDSSKSIFVGKESMLAHKASAWTHRLVGLEVHKRIARSHCAIVDGDTEVGEVTSGTKSPWTGKSIALARIRRSHAKPGTTLEVDIRGKRVPATVVKGAFFTRDY